MVQRLLIKEIFKWFIILMMVCYGFAGKFLYIRYMGPGCLAGHEVRSATVSKLDFNFV